MARGFWSGAIRFGLVNIPVSMHPASESVDLDFDLVDSRDFSPVGYRKVNKNTGKEVPREKIVKTIKVDGDERVVVTDEDFARARPKGSRNLDLIGVVALGLIEPAYFDTPYVLEPTGKDAHAYVLLRETLKTAGKAGIAKGVLRTRERMGAVYADGDHLMFNTLRFAHEMRKRAPSELIGKAAPAAKSELDMARRLVDEMSMTWEPKKHRDEYHDQLLEYIRKKAKAGEGRKVYAPDDAEPEGEAPTRVDLMKLLKDSLSGSARSSSKRRPRSA